MKQELALVALIVIFLILKIASDERDSRSWVRIFNILMGVNVIAGWVMSGSGSLFGGMYFTDHLIAFEKNILNSATYILCLSSTAWLERHRHTSEFYILIITSLLGMYFMLSSANLMMFYIALELSAIPLAALCNFDLVKLRSSEAAMKMIFSSAFSSAILLLGISFLYGTSGSLTYQAVSVAPVTPLLVTGFVFFFAGLIFKLSVVPFHLWTADVYEGSPVAVTAFLSVVSKGSVVFVLTSFLYHVFRNFTMEWYYFLCILSVMTMITGNLFAIRQENMKRFLAFSSITQIGFILTGISGCSQDGMASAIYFILIYLFSNLATFAVVALISEKTGKETISSYRGLARTNPLLAWSFAIALFSLAGVPPTAGFFGKIFLITAGASVGNYVLVTIAALNMMVALYYYLRVIRAVFMDEPGAEIIPAMKSGFTFRLAMFICLFGILVTGFYGPLYTFIHSLSNGL